MSRKLYEKQILVVDSEALIGLDLVFALEEIGATVLVAPSAGRAREILKLRHVAAAVIDPSTSDEARALCAHFSEAGIPFVVHCGRDVGETGAAYTVAKPALATTIAAAVASLFERTREVALPLSAPQPRQRSAGGLQ